MSEPQTVTPLRPEAPPVSDDALMIAGVPLASRRFKGTPRNTSQARQRDAREAGGVEIVRAMQGG